MVDFSREITLIGQENFDLLQSKTVAVFGLGGVGGYSVETLARMGIGKLILIDGDKVSSSNINRQIIATVDTIGEYKTKVFEKRILSINPNCEVTLITKFIDKTNIDEIDFSKIDFCIDAIDSLYSKIDIIKACQKANTPIISCMGTGNKLNPTVFEISDIFKTSVCPLAKKMRKLCKENGIEKLKVVYSKEEVVEVGQRTPASISFVPGVAGLMMTYEAYKTLTKKD